MADKLVLLFSGGLDSTTLLYELCQSDVEVVPLFVNYGQSDEEEKAALTILSEARKRKKLCNFVISQVSSLRGKLTDIDAAITSNTTASPYFVPGRNSVFALLGYNLAVGTYSRNVVLGINGDDAKTFPDCSRDWYLAMHTLFNINNSALHRRLSVNLVCPYMNTPRYKIQNRAKELGVPLELVMSCYKPIAGKPCGECDGCRK